jgi:hypothetical protein
MKELFNLNFYANLKLFLRLSNCASVGEKTLIIIMMHVVYVPKNKTNLLNYSMLHDARTGLHALLLLLLLISLVTGLFFLVILLNQQ